MTDVIITTNTETLVVETVAVTDVIETAGEQGPPGKNGLDGMELSSLPDNQITKRPDGLYVPPASWSLKEW